MIWLAAIVLAALTLAPLVLYAWGTEGRLRGRQEAALALHRAQLLELDRDLAEGRLVVSEHAAAKLEVQRRLLADAALPDSGETPGNSAVDGSPADGWPAERVVDDGLTRDIQTNVERSGVERTVVERTGVERTGAARTGDGEGGVGKTGFSKSGFSKPHGGGSAAERAFVPLAAAIIPVAAAALYLTVGHPGFPPSDNSAGQAAAGPAIDPAKRAQDEVLVGQLRNRLALMDPHAPNTLKGYEILGNAELSLGHMPEAASAWQHVLSESFNPTLAMETAEVMTEMAGRVTPEALTMFKRAVAEAPADAPWRKMAERRIAEGSGG